MRTTYCLQGVRDKGFTYTTGERGRLREFEEQGRGGSLLPVGRQDAPDVAFADPQYLGRLTNC